MPMALPDFRPDGTLPPGIHAASLAEVRSRFGTTSPTRQAKSDLLAEVVAAALHYPTVKRVLVWGSFVTAKPEPDDLDNAVIVSVGHDLTEVTEAHRRLLVPFEARRAYGIDPGYLVIRDYPLGSYIERLDFLCQRYRRPYGIVEISLRGEMTGETT
jgi:hypothetical protein